MNIKVPVTVERLTALCLESYHCLIISREKREILYEGGMRDIPAYLKEEEVHGMTANAEENGKYVEITYYIL